MLLTAMVMPYKVLHHVTPVCDGSLFNQSINNIMQSLWSSLVYTVVLPRVDNVVLHYQLLVVLIPLFYRISLC